MAIKPGDIIFVRGHDLISSIIKYFDKGQFSHVCMAVSDTRIVEAQYGKPVRITPFKYKDYEVVDLGLSDIQREALIKEAIVTTGTIYDWVQDLGYVFNQHWGSSTKYICSEEIYILLSSIQIQIGDHFIEPNELYKAIIEWKKKNKIA